MKNLILVLLLAIPVMVQAERAKNFQDALKHSDNTKDIAVFLHGSDWCPLGEWVKNNLWVKQETETALKKLILVSINKKEYTDVKMNKAFQRLKNRRPKSVKLIRLKGENGTKFSKKSDDSYLIRKPYPKNDIYSFTIRTTKPTQTLWVEALPDKSLPNASTGCADNGNFFVNEFTATISGKEITFKTAWADRHKGNNSANFVIDNDLNKRTGWNPDATKDSDRRTLLLLPTRPIPAGLIKCKIYFSSPWSSHLIGRLRIRADYQTTTQNPLSEWGKDDTARQTNSTFKGSTDNYPAIVLCNPQGQPYGEISGIDKYTTLDQIKQQVAHLQRLQKKRQYLITDIANATRLNKASLIGKWLDIPELYRDRNQINDLINQLEQADPNDSSGYVRKYTFDPSDMRREVLKLVKNEQYSKAITLIDKELSNPGNRRLSHEQLQQIHQCKVTVYKSWKGHEEKIFDILKKIVKMDPTTHTGKGAKGYLLMNGIGETSITYGWRPAQLKNGQNTWHITIDTPRYFDHAGKYRITIQKQNKNGGTNDLEITSVSLIANGKTSTDTHTSLASTNKTNQYIVELNKFNKNTKVTLKITTKTKGGTDSKGTIKVFPLLD